MNHESRQSRAVNAFRPDRGATGNGAGARWKLSRAGIINVYQYGDETLHFGDGRLLLRGVNGSGKSTAMNMLLPFLLDGDTRRIDAAGEQSGVLRSWMLSGRDEPQPQGYLWLELALGDAYTSFGHGEAAGRRWRDLDESALPLGALTIATQYSDQPLKTKTPRVVPVHPVLAQLLTSWKSSGFADFFCRQPQPQDFVVPSRTGKCRASGTSHQGLQQDCAAIGIPGRRVHDTRHTFISLARRDGARKDVLERITHNSAGDIVDRYTTFDWAPLCEAVTCLRLSLTE